MIIIKLQFIIVYIQLGTQDIACTNPHHALTHEHINNHFYN